MLAQATICGTGVVKGGMAKTAYFVHSLNGRTKPFAIPQFGLAGIDPTHLSLAEAVEAWIGKKAGPVVIFAHSQGTIHALKFTLDHPDLVKGVVLLGGPIGGSPLVRWVPGPLQLLLEHLAPSVLDMKPGSLYLEALRRRVGAEWPHHTPVRLIAGQYDWLVPYRSALDLEFPLDTDVRRYYFGLNLPADVPVGTKLVRTPPPLSGHLSLMVDLRVLRIISRLRQRAAVPIAA